MLARVQSFLPQLQQANISLPADHAGGSAFELIEENSDDDESDDSESDAIESMQQEDSDGNSEGDEAVEAQPQIVMVRYLRLPVASLFLVG